ncbi:MAG: GNAT family N-acetyltransferase [Eubacteriales bacterium]|nr:GNAT family N-acetyltransferase [Eubacteriales bacterium]
MTDEIYGLYLICFPGYQCSRECFDGALKPEQAVIFSEHENESLIAFAMIWGNSVSLLCVHPLYRNRGIGSRLLEKAEAHIAKSGADRVILGRGSRYLLQGVPADGESVPFFKKRGYKASWTSVNMMIDTAGFDYDSLDIPALPADICFRYAADADRAQLLSAVDDAQPGWRRIFEECAEPVLLAVERETDRITGFEIVSKDGGWFLPDAGSIGCVGVVKSARGKGIGRQMVAQGIQRLKSPGCPCIELRYVALADWYSALGFRVYVKQWMGEKVLQI